MSLILVFISWGKGDGYITPWLRGKNLKKINGNNRVKIFETVPYTHIYNIVTKATWG